MFEELRRTAFIPVVIAALIAAGLAGLIGSAGTLAEPMHSMLVAGTGAVGAMVGSTMLQAQQRAEDGRRARNALRTMLHELAATLESDTRMINSPMADEAFNILKQEDLVAFTERAVRSAQQVSGLAVPNPIFGEGVNANLATLRIAVDSFVPLMSAAMGSARRLPATVEEFYIPIGGTKRLQGASANLLRLLAATEKDLDR